MKANIGNDKARDFARAQASREAEKGVMALAMRAAVGQSGMPAGTTADPSMPGSQADPRVVQSILGNLGLGQIVKKPDGVSIPDDQWMAIQALVQSMQYCPSPRKTGWQPGSLTFRATGILTGATATITVTATKAFDAQALVGSNGYNTTSAILNSLTINGENQIDDPPWIMQFFRSDAACCLRAKNFRLVPPNTQLVMSITNTDANTQNLEVMLFGDALFC